MADIFISYAREDREHARTLAEMLERHGWTVWWDRLIPAGESFNRMIENELNRARCVIVLWSRHSIDSNYVQNEATEAEGQRKLVPVLLEHVRIPLAFRHLQATLLIDEERGHLLSSIRSLVGRGGEAAAASQAPAPARRTTWISAIVIAAVVVTIALIAKKADEPRSDPPSETSNGTNDRIPRDEVLEISLWHNQVDQSVNAYTSEPEKRLQVASRNLVVKVHCRAGVDCHRVTVLFGNERRAMIAENAAVNTPLISKISVEEIGSLGGKRLQVLYDTVEMISFQLWRADSVRAK